MDVKSAKKIFFAISSKLIQYNAWTIRPYLQLFVLVDSVNAVREVLKHFPKLKLRSSSKHIDRQEIIYLQNVSSLNPGSHLLCEIRTSTRIRNLNNIKRKDKRIPSVRRDEIHAFFLIRTSNFRLRLGCS